LTERVADQKWGKEGLHKPRGGNSRGGSYTKTSLKDSWGGKGGTGTLSIRRSLGGKKRRSDLTIKRERGQKDHVVRIPEKGGRNVRRGGGESTRRLGGEPLNGHFVLVGYFFMTGGYPKKKSREVDTHLRKGNIGGEGKSWKGEGFTRRRRCKGPFRLGAWSNGKKDRAYDKI